MFDEGGAVFDEGGAVSSNPNHPLNIVLKGLIIYFWRDKKQNLKSPRSLGLFKGSCELMFFTQKKIHLKLAMGTLGIFC